MKIEILYPECCNLYGDTFNMKYLKQCLPEAEFIETAIGDVPIFTKEKVNLIYLGTMTERMQEKVVNELSPYKKEIKENIENGIPFLITGNAVEVFGKYMENEDGSKVEGLGIINLWAKRDMFNRFNCVFSGKFEDMEIVGFKSQFTMAYVENEDNGFIKVEKGIGLNKTSKLEGIKKNNFIATYLLGPILVLNPLFTRYLLSIMGVEEPKLAFEQDLLLAYEQRVNEFQGKVIVDEKNKRL